MDQSTIAEWDRKSWVESANDPACGFPLQSLPYCIFTGDDGYGRLGVGVGNSILDLEKCSHDGWLAGLPSTVRVACQGQTLNALVACPAAEHAALRRRLQDLLDLRRNKDQQNTIRAALRPMDGATLLKPVEAPNFTDFFASIDHATRVGRLFRPEQPLLPNYKFVPIGYHGRASSVVVSGTPVRRPRGQSKPAQNMTPAFGPSNFLDYEIEVGAYISQGNRLGEPIDITGAEGRIFGLSLVNDWSARDTQSWEYQPLGPFLGKSFATTVSPWVVPMQAFAPFRIPAAPRPEGDPAPLNYLCSSQDQESGAIDLTLEAFLLTSEMRNAGLAAVRLSRSNLRDLYWTLAQMVTHHSSNGCNLMPGDLLATGTVSGPAEDSAGCLLELTKGGGNAILLPNGESRRALEDGDEVILRGVCQREGIPKISLGECRGVVLPSH
jgi:fumarylacetoacetase